MATMKNYLNIHAAQAKKIKAFRQRNKLIQTKTEMWGRVLKHFLYCHSLLSESNSSASQVPLA